MADTFGYKTTLSYVLPASFVFWTLLAYGTNVIILYCSRFGLGVILGILVALVPPLIAEMSDDKIRGFALGTPGLLAGIGFLFGSLQAYLFEWRLGTIIQLLPLLPVILILPFIPEVLKKILILL